MDSRAPSIAAPADRLRRLWPPLITLAIFAAALVALRLELAQTTWPRLWSDVAATAPTRIALAVLLTIASYLALTGYDFLALASIRRSLPKGRVAVTSFVSYAVSHTVGLALLSGASVRYRFYTRSGIGVTDLSRIIVSSSLTFWLGLLTLGGISLVLAPLPAALSATTQVAIRLAGSVSLTLAVLFVAFTALGSGAVRIWRFKIPMPTPRLAAMQLAVSTIDWALAAAVLFVLLPHTVPFGTFAGIYLAAVVLGLASHVPGGLGVFESALAWLLSPYMASSDLLPALVVYRAIYYLAPFAVALVVLAVDELWQRRVPAGKLSGLFAQVRGWVTPRLAGLLTFLAGVVLLVSGATPAAAGRLDRLSGWVPLGAIEAAHFFSSIIGALLLVLSQGLARRLDGAFYLAAAALSAGIAASLLKGLDYEEAIFLVIVLGVLLKARPAFSRRAAFFETRFSPAWIATVVAAIGAAIWLGLFAFKNVAYSHDLWWQFELRSEASRSLRAGVGAALVVLVFGAGRLIRPAPVEVESPTDADLEDADRIIGRQSATMPNLVFLRDKGVMFNATRTAFLMYAVQGRTWVALGDPVGPSASAEDLIRMFLERCNDFGGTPVFYQVLPDRLHRYIDMGLASTKLGEDAVVDLTTLTFAGGRGKRFRQALRRLETAGGSFDVVPACEVDRIIGDLAQVSQAWLQAKRASEKGFSLGFFDEAYLSRFPVAVIRRAGRIEAFANVWPGGDGVELSVDLMRFRPDAPENIMETLLVHLMKWGQDRGFARFALGMAPLSGLAASPAASWWTRIGRFVYRHGGSVYNFRGLRAFKDKFSPDWQPRYLAYPGGAALPRILTDVSALVAGGYRQLFRA